MKRLLKILIAIAPFMAIPMFEFVLQKKLQFYYWDWHKAITLTQFGLYFWASFSVLALSMRWKSNLGSSLGVFLLFFFIIDIVFYFLLGMPPARQQFNFSSNRPGHISYDVGVVPLPNDTFHDTRMFEGDTMFSVDYIIDDHHRRVTPGQDSQKTKYAAFFGCSVCYGFGVKGDQTLAYHVQENSCDLNSYNFGYNGWGMHHMLARFDHENLAETVDEDGVGIYVMLWSHIRRAIGDMRIYTGWGHQMPHYTIEGGKLVRRRNFKDGRFWKSSFYTLINSSFAARYFDVNLPAETSEEDYLLAAEIILQAKRHYIQQFGNNRFYVLMHLFSGMNSRLSENSNSKNSGRKGHRVSRLFRRISH